MSNKYCFYILLCLVMMTKALTAQSIQLTGKLEDQDQNPIEFANVLAKDSANPSTIKGNVTNEFGQFELTFAQATTIELKISFIGFDDWQKTLNLTESIDLGVIKLQPITNKLQEVVVKADRNIITQKEDRLVFNVATSPLKTGYDGLEVLQRSPNVIVDLDGNILIRNEAPTVMINGRITNLSGTTLANYISNLRSEDIKSIEIQSHLSANTDGESSGGVINIILKKQPVGIVGNARASYTTKGGGFKNTFGGMNLNYGTDKWNLYGLCNYSYNSGESEIENTLDYFATEDLILSQENYQYYSDQQNIQVGFLGNLSKNHILGLEGFRSSRDFEFENNGLINVFQRASEVEAGNALAAGGIDNQLYTATMNYQWNFDTLNSSFKLFADYANQQVDRPNQNISTYRNGFLADNTERNNSTANTLIYSIQADLEKNLRNGFKFEVGAKLTATDRENLLASDLLINGEWLSTNRTNAFNYSEKVMAGYLSVNKKLTTNIFFEVGLRAERTNLDRIDLADNSVILQDYTNWFPNFYLSRNLKDNRTVSLSYSKRIRRPPFHYLNNNVVKINDFRYELGNPDLIPENVNNWELAFNGKKQRLDFYLQRTTEAINGIYYQEGQAAYYQKFNEGIQQQLGMNYNYFGNITPWWYLNFTGRLWNRKFINSLGENSFRRTTLRLKINNNFKLNSTTSLDIIGDYISPYEDAYYIVYTRFRLNFMVQKLFFNKKLNCRIYVTDLLNTLEDDEKRPFENFTTFRYEKWRSRQLRLWISYNFSSRNQLKTRKNTSKNDARRRL